MAKVVAIILLCTVCFGLGWGASVYLGQSELVELRRDFVDARARAFDLERRYGIAYGIATEVRDEIAGAGKLAEGVASGIERALILTRALRAALEDLGELASLGPVNKR